MMRLKHSFGSLLGATLALLGAATAAHAQAAPANDNFANAQVLTTATGTVSNDTTYATAEPGEPAHDTIAAGASVWYNYVPNYDGTVIFDAANSSIPYPILAVYTGAKVNALKKIAANYDGGDFYTSTSVSFNVQAKKTYRIAVDGYYSSQYAIDRGPVSITWRRVQPPVNDKFSNATVVPGTSFSENTSNVDATPESGEPDHAGVEPFYSIWYKWTPITSGPVTITTQGSAVDTLLAVYLGTSVKTLTEVKSNDDVSSSVRTSSVTFQAQANAIYYIAVDSYDEGAITFNLNQTLGSPTRYQVSGTVKTDQSAALAGVIISLNGATDSNKGTTATATTDASGVYTITNILDGTYTVTATKRGYTTSPDSLTVTVAKANSVDNNFTATLIPIPVLPDVSVSSVSIREGNKGDSYMSFNVSLSKASTDIIAVGYATDDGTATAGSDYTAVKGNLLFPAGTVTLAVKVKLLPDTKVEADETFKFLLLGATGANIVDPSGIGTILNDDASTAAASAPSARSAKAPIKAPNRVRLARLFPR